MAAYNATIAQDVTAKRRTNLVSLGDRFPGYPLIDDIAMNIRIEQIKFIAQTIAACHVLLKACLYVVFIIKIRSLFTIISNKWYNSK